MQQRRPGRSGPAPAIVERPFASKAVVPRGASELSGVSWRKGTAQGKAGTLPDRGVRGSRSDEAVPIFCPSALASGVQLPLDRLQFEISFYQNENTSKVRLVKVSSHSGLWNLSRVAILYKFVSALAWLPKAKGASESGSSEGAKGTTGAELLEISEGLQSALEQQNQHLNSTLPQQGSFEFQIEGTASKI